MIGRSTSAFPYVLKADKEGLEKSQWTTWNLKPILPAQSGRQLSKMMAAIVERPGSGTKEIKEGKFNRATFEAWMGVINSVENFCFANEGEDSQLSKEQKAAINVLQKEGFITIAGDDEEKLTLVYLQLPGSERQEILDAADELSISTVQVVKKK